jgi:hypothetical protein
MDARRHGLAGMSGKSRCSPVGGEVNSEAVVLFLAGLFSASFLFSLFLSAGRR